jgi:ATP-binding cassette subfamily F protein uup
LPKEVINTPKIIKSNNKERNELKKLEREIESLEEKKAQIEMEISNTALAYDKIETLSQEIGKIVSDINIKTERWMELVDKF